MTKKSSISPELQQRILLLRFGTISPTTRTPPLFSLTCICRYLRVPYSRVSSVVTSYFASESRSDQVVTGKKQRDAALDYLSSKAYLEEHPLDSLAQRVAHGKKLFALNSKHNRLTVYYLRKRYKKLGIRFKSTRSSSSSINKYSDIEMSNFVKEAQLKLLEADAAGAVCYALDESVFDARYFI